VCGVCGMCVFVCGMCGCVWCVCGVWCVWCVCGVCVVCVCDLETSTMRFGRVGGLCSKCLQFTHADWMTSQISQNIRKIIILLFSLIFL